MAVEAALHALLVVELAQAADTPCIEPALFLKRTIPRSGLVVLPRSGPAINLEEPEMFNRHVLDFLTAVDSGKW